MRILYQAGDYFVISEAFGKTDGFAVYRNGTTAATRCASIGYSGENGLARAIFEADKRAGKV